MTNSRIPVYFACFAIDVWERRRGWSDVQALLRIYSDFGDRIRFQRMGSNENKMSDGGRERASLAMSVWKSSQM